MAYYYVVMAVYDGQERADHDRHLTQLPLVRIDGSSTTCLSLGEALGQATGSATLRTRDVTFGEDINLNRPLDISLFGRFKDDFTAVDGYTELQGTLTLGFGSLTVDGLAIR